jgi:hypothetical protein
VHHVIIPKTEPNEDGYPKVQQHLMELPECERMEIGAATRFAPREHGTRTACVLFQPIAPAKMTDCASPCCSLVNAS